MELSSITKEQKPSSADDCLAIGNLFASLGSQKFLRGAVFGIASLPNFMEEHLIAIETQQSGVIYVRLVYEKFSGKLRLSYLTLDSPYERARIKRSMFGAPPRIDCE